VQSQYREAVVAARNAIALAEAVDVPAEAGHAYNTLGVGLVMAGETAPGLAALKHAHSIADTLGGIEDRLRARNNLSYAYMNRGRYRDALSTALAGFALARRHGLAATAGALLLTNAATALVWLGEWVEADQLAQEELDQDVPAGLAAALHLTRAEVAVATGDQPGADQHLQRARTLADDLDEPQLSGHLAACHAESLLWQGNSAPVAAVVADGLAQVGVGEDDQLALRLCALGLRGAADRAELARLRRRPTTDRDVAELRATVERLLARLPDGAFPEARADAAMAAAEAGRAEAARPGAARSGARPGGPDAWADAARHWNDLDRPYPRAYCQWRAAETLFATKAPLPARRVLHEAYDTARTVGAQPLLTEIEALARRTRTDLTEPTGRARSRPAAGHDSAPAPDVSPGSDPGLTAREREVLALVCDGLTNRQIARHLFISEKTASVHVSHIMTKLDAPTRGAAAAAAHRLALAGSQG
jgi:DNA-binding CsgD family transcriptional regulator